MQGQTIETVEKPAGSSDRLHPEETAVLELLRQKPASCVGRNH